VPPETRHPQPPPALFLHQPEPGIEAPAGRTGPQHSFLTGDVPDNLGWIRDGTAGRMLPVFLRGHMLGDEDLRRIQLAAADKEIIEFELDRAELALSQAITVAVNHGVDVRTVADVAELPVEDVITLVQHSDAPLLDTMATPALIEDSLPPAVSEASAPEPSAQG
jgi:hypothetical protein